MDIWTLDSEGHLISQDSFESFDRILIINQNEQTTNVWTGEYGTIKNCSYVPLEEAQSGIYFQVDDDHIASSIFEYLADNSSVEWSQIKTGKHNDNQLNYIGTSHEEHKERVGAELYGSILKESFVRDDIHSHPSNMAFPSGLSDNNDYPTGDIKSAVWLESKYPDIKCKIYIPAINDYIDYNSKSRTRDFPLRGTTILNTLNVNP